MSYDLEFWFVLDNNGDNVPPPWVTPERNAHRVTPQPEIAARRTFNPTNWDNRDERHEPLALITSLPVTQQLRGGSMISSDFNSTPIFLRQPQQFQRGM